MHYTKIHKREKEGKKKRMSKKKEMWWLSLSKPPHFVLQVISTISMTTYTKLIRHPFVYKKITEKNYCNLGYLSKYAFVSLETTPARTIKAIQLGIAIRAFVMLAKVHTEERVI